MRSRRNVLQRTEITLSGVAAVVIPFCVTAVIL
jgi:hypothetical protein